MRILLPLLTSLSCLNHGVISALPTLCSPPSPWTVTSRDLVNESRGFLLLVVYMPIRCGHCLSQLKRFDSLTGREIRIVVIVPNGERVEDVHHAQRQFQRLTVLQETNENLPVRLSLQLHDQLIYDRCGRLANVVRHPHSDMGTHEDTMTVLKSAVNYARCGWCKYDSLRTHHRFDERRGQDEQRIDQQQQQQQQQQQETARRVIDQQREQSRRVQEEQRRSQQHVPQNRRPSNDRHPHRQHHQQQQQQQQQQHHHHHHHHHQQQQQRQQQQQQQQQQHQQQQHLYDDDDYIDQSDITSSTPSVQQQIPGTRSPLSISIDQLPCAAFTDDVCFQQQLKYGRLPQCCNRGLYLTDACIPSKCNNQTIQLCCVEKFLQAKYMCCHQGMDISETSPGDEFSRCCHGHFILSNDQDPCCPTRSAERYWRGGIYELCLPHVTFDMSSVRLQAKLNDGKMVSLDLSGDEERWRFSCPVNGSDHFFYLPDPLPSNNPIP